MAFYMAFGRAYDRARALGPQPMRQLRDVNPWLSESQCKSYLKRARALGQVQAPGRTQAKATQDAGTTVTLAGTPVQVPLPDFVDTWRDLDIAATSEMVAMMHGPTCTLDRARKMMAGWVDAGLAEWSGNDAVRFPPAVG
jgi:hypothetical protein